MKAVIPAAGLGTRLLPATKSMPKEMLPVLDKPVIQYVVEEAVASGLDEILIVTGRQKRAIEDHFDRSPELERHLERAGKKEALGRLKKISDLATIHYVRQAEPLGLGNAVQCAERFVGDEPFALLLGDDLLLDKEAPTKKLIRAHEATGYGAVMVRRVPRDLVSRYGIVRAEPLQAPRGAHRVWDIVEKPTPSRAPSDLAVMGRYVLPPEIFGILKRIRPGHGGEYQLTDALAVLCKKQPLLALEFAGRRLDVGSPEGFLEANLFVALSGRDSRDARRLVERLLKETGRQRARDSG